MKFFVVATLLVASACSANSYGAVSSQYQSQDTLGQYSYGYADPNSQKHESRSADGVTHGGYSYVDAHGIVQSVKYVADPHTGFHVTGTNLPKGPAPAAGHAYVAAAPVHYAAAPIHYAAPYAYAPVALTHGGVPVDTPEVQHAKAEHFAAHAAARSGHHLHKRSISAWGYAAAPSWGYAAAPAIHNGVPVDTPEVQHAKAEHFAAHAKALSGHHAAPYGYAHNGAPAETPEVQHAKAAHFAAHAAARAGHPIAHAAYAHAPVIHNGVPVDTPEVQHAKAAHFAAVAKAKSQAYSAPHHESGHYYGDAHHETGQYYAAPAHYYSGPQHIPVIHNGVPVETPEVQHAKAAHFAALAEASSRSHGHGQWDNGHGHNEW